MPEPLILASGSTTRANALRAAGVAFAVEPANIDEDKIKREHRAAGHGVAACAMALAEAKAGTIASHRPGVLVIGADQILVAGDRWFDKPVGLEDAASQLRALRGCEHVLVTAACVYRDGSPLWRVTTTPKLAMRRFSDAFLTDYITAEGEDILGSVGAYRIEGRGLQLFERIEGDYFLILGLPLLELLEFLRRRGALGE